jgi:hypothetical protein
MPLVQKPLIPSEDEGLRRAKPRRVAAWFDSSRLRSNQSLVFARDERLNLNSTRRLALLPPQPKRAKAVLVELQTQSHERTTAGIAAAFKITVMEADDVIPQ